MNVNDPAAQGFSMNYYIPSAFENIQVSTGAQDISIGTAGVFINMVTKSGTNRFGGQALQTYQGEQRPSGTTSTRRSRPGFRPERERRGLITNTTSRWADR